MIKWVPFPFIRFFVAFAAGIVTYLIFEKYIEGLFYVIISIWAVYIFLLRKKDRRFYSLNPYYGVIALTAIFITGYWHASEFDNKHDPENLIAYDKKVEYFSGTIDSYTQETDKYYRFYMELDKFRNEGKWEEIKGRVLTYLRKDDSVKIPFYGSYILVRGNPWKVNGPMNPNEFNYKKYLERKNIFHQSFITRDDLIICKDEPPNPVESFALTLRKELQEILTRSLGEERMIANALILGIKDDLSNKLKDAYASAGAMHILAVSGLHVGMIYGILLLLLRPLKKRKWGKWGLAIISIAFLWFFALLTGFSPSVFRAVTMFTFIILAVTIRRQTNIYNTLAASAFILLCFNPFLITSVGFQLSYLAVLGIVFLYPRIYNRIEFNNHILDKIWSLTVVGFAAQIGTLPLSLFYFKQFPTYFFISNLVVIPSAFIILTLGITLFVFSWIHFIFSTVSFLLRSVINMTNEFVFFVNDLPFSTFHGITLSVSQTILFYCAIILFILLFELKKYLYLKWLFICIISIFLSFIYDHWKASISERIVFYHIRQQTVIDFIKGNTYSSWLDSNKAEQDISYHVNPYRISSDLVKSALQVPAKGKEGFKILTWEGKTILRINDLSKISSSNENIHVDYLLLADDRIKELDQVLELFSFEKLIIDSSMRFYSAETLKNEAETLNLDFYSIPHQGALVVNI